MDAGRAARIPRTRSIPLRRSGLKRRRHPREVSSQPPSGPVQSCSSSSAAITRAWRSWASIPNATPGIRSIGALGAPNLLSSYTWTGRDVVVFGGVDQLHGIEEGTDRAWSFDAASGAWSELPSAPVRMSAPTAAWSGQELIAAGWSGPLLHPSTDSLQTVAFDPASSAWRTLPDTQLGIVPTGAVAVDERPIIWQPSADSSFEWRKAAGAWTPIPAPYLGGGGCPVDTAAISGFAFGWACGHPAVFSAATSSWSPVDPPITWDATITPPGVAVAVGDGFVVSAFVPTPDAGATEGSPDTHLWFWRPPTP